MHALFFMANLSKMYDLKRFEKPDEHREFKGHGSMDILAFANGMTFGRGKFEPGWRWSNDVKPLVGTESCEVAHSGICLKGSMVIRMNSGEEFRVREGDAFEIAPGHEAWVDGNVACEFIDVTGATYYATEKKGDIPQMLMEGFNSRDMSKIASVLSDDVEWLDVARQTVYRGIAGHREYEKSWLDAFPDGKVEIINVISQGDRMVMEYIGRGTHLGPIEGPNGTIHATGECVQLPMCDVLQIRNGKVFRGHTYYDASTLIEQLIQDQGRQAQAA